MIKNLSLIGFIVFTPLIYASESVCYGTTKNGKLEGGVKLPGEGNNFISYGAVPELVGRTYVHSKVRDVFLSAYKMLEKENPDKVFKYAETGFKDGGEFKPHKTHRNGLSIDFMVPVINKNNQSSYFPTNVLNKYGYNVNFDKTGKNKEYKIDFDALGAHIVALHKSAIDKGIEVWRVLFAPDLQPLLYATRYGEYIRTNVVIPNKTSWVRHDEHYHVDFKVNCRSYSANKHLNLMAKKDSPQVR